MIWAPRLLLSAGSLLSLPSQLLNRTQIPPLGAKELPTGRWLAPEQAPLMPSAPTLTSTPAASGSELSLLGNLSKSLLFRLSLQVNTDLPWFLWKQNKTRFRNRIYFKYIYHNLYSLEKVLMIYFFAIALQVLLYVYQHFRRWEPPELIYTQ